MKIAYITHHFLPEPSGGSGIYVYDLAREMLQRGHQVAIFCRDYDHAEQAYTLHVHEYDSLPVTAISFGSNTTNLVSNLIDPKLDELFQNWLEQFQPEIIHFNTPQNLSLGMIQAAAKTPARLTQTVHDHWFICPIYVRLRPDGQVCRQHAGAGCLACVYPSRDRRRTRWIPWQLVEFGILPLLRPFVKKSHLISHYNPFEILGWLETRPKVIVDQLKILDRIIVPSNYLFEKIKIELYSTGVNFPEEKIITIGHGISFGENPTGYFSPKRMAKVAYSSYKPHKGNVVQPIRIGFLGYFSPVKGLFVLLQSLQGLDRSRLDIRVCGGIPYGSYGRALSKLSQSLGIELEPPLTRSEVVEFFSKIDVLVVPSIAEETFSYVTREAFAAGVPVVASNLGSLSEAIHDGIDGLLFEPGNPNDLRRKIKLLIDNPDLVDQLSANIPPVKSIHQYSQEIEELYQSLAIPP